MAKSMRSKWKRKCRAVKRVRYGQKELDRLKKIVSNDPLNGPKDEEMKDSEQVVTIVNKETMNVSSKVMDQTNKEVTETDAEERIYNPKTMKDQFGAYPVWMSKRNVDKKKRNLRKKKFKH